MAINIKSQEYHEEEVGGYTYAVVGGAFIIDDRFGGNPITQNGSQINRVFHITNIHYRNRNTKGNNILQIYDGVVAAANLKFELFMGPGISNEIVNIRGVRFRDQINGILCVAQINSIFVHVGGKLIFN